MIFPDRTNESYHYTSFAKLNGLKLVAPAATPVERDILGLIAPFDEEGAPRLVFINGRLSPSLSAQWQAAGLELETFTDEACAWEEDPFVRFNAAQTPTGPLLRIPSNTSSERPLKIFHVALSPKCAPGTKTFLSPRLRLILGAGAKFHVEEYRLCAPDADHLENATLEIHLETGAELVHHGVFLTGAATTGVYSVIARVAAGAAFTAHGFSLGAGQERHNLAVVLAGHEAACRLYGLYAIGAGRHVDHRTHVEHAVANTASEQVYKGIIATGGRSAFNGKVVIAKDAQKSAAMQLNRNLILGPNAEANAKPELDIAADDVKCSHGATVGRLGDEETFYLESRGIPRAEARSILVRGFARDVLNRAASPFLRAKLDAVLRDDFFEGA